MMTTFAKAMSENKGHTTGFDYLRIFLATMVVLDHAFLLQPTGPLDIYTTRFEVFWNTILPGFFALSGVLVASSLIRNTIPEFIGLRVLRLFPALVVEVTLSAIVLGAVFTTLPLRDYFADPMFHRYFLNIIGIIHFPLPGVFDGAKINPQLWTIPIELDCYIAIVAIGMLGLVKRRWLLLALVLGAQIVLTIVSIYHPLIQPQHPPTGRLLVFSFLSGTLIHYFRDWVPYHVGLFVAAIAAMWLTLSYPVLGFLSPFPTAYVIAYIGLWRLPRIKFGDLSYGLYLFHFPLMHVINELTGRQLNWYQLFPLAMIVGCSFAAMSWNLIEKPLLSRKKDAMAVIDRLIPVALHRKGVFNPIESSDVRRVSKPLEDQPAPFSAGEPHLMR